jgi:hypothetical protein
MIDLSNSSTTVDKNAEIIILTGAGISNLFGLPMTSGFTSLINESSRFELNSLLSNYLGKEMNDIEKVMFTLEDCLDDENQNLQKHILEANKYFPNVRDDNGRVVSSTFVNQTIKSTYQEIKKNAQNFLFNLKNGIYNLLDSPDIEKASTLYLNILTQIKTKYPNSEISIFTTNYDLSFEKSCRSNREKLKKLGIDTDTIEYGFILQDGILGFNTDARNSERKHLEYYKLHGSLDWHYDSTYGCTKSGANARPSHPETMPILYPGIKGKPKKDPFIKLHDIFYDRLQTVDTIIVLGFAFRDPYINELIRFSKGINKKYRMLFFNPTKLEELPQESGLYEFKQLFGKDLQYINSRIEIDGSPLKDYLN